MPNQTPNLNLTKPLQTEYYNIDVHNANSDIIDTAIGNINTDKSDKLTAGNAIVLTKDAVAKTVNVAVDPNLISNHNIDVNSHQDIRSKLIGKQEEIKYTLIDDVKPSGTGGGDVAALSWIKRTINNKTLDQIGVTLQNSQITLPAGSYLFNAKAPAFRVGLNRSRLQNITDNSTVAYSSSEEANDSTAYNNQTTINTFFTLTDSKTFEIQHYCQGGRTVNGFGEATSFAGIPEIYTRVFITKLK